MRLGTAIIACFGIAGAGWLMRDDALGAACDLLVSGQSKPSPGDTQLTLVSLNVWDQNPTPALALDFLEKSDADVIIVAEARELFVSALQRRLARYPTQITCADRPYCGVVIFARDAGAPDRGGATIVWPPPARNNPPQNLLYAAARISKPNAKGGDLTFPVVAVHVERGLTVGAAPFQLEKLAHNINQTGDPDDMLIAGDLNTTGASPGLQTFSRSIRARRLTYLVGTWPTKFAMRAPWAPALFSIDHIYAGKHWRLLDLRRSGAAGSDHYALIARLAWSPGGAPKAGWCAQESGAGR